MEREKKLHTDNFGVNVFSDKEMRARLPKEVYDSLKKVVEEDGELTKELSEVVASAMKDWALEHGATHYTHWFQPLNGFTAEKHESFIAPAGGGEAVMEFSGKMLIKGESDASSFPSGGLRQTFEARGYTTWDCTSPDFLKEDRTGVSLCIPTAFCSYTSEALDEKTPLLRSIRAIESEALRLCRTFGDHKVKHVRVSVGAEQEYFLIDRELYNKRNDLIFTGRTLLGACPPKCQELEDHYYGAIDERISAFMAELDEELWKLGVFSKTKHNEVAPAQYELAPIYTTVNIAADQNQLIMETAKKVAGHHGLVCLLHEKPFAYINGSGKHNNWSLCTDDGQNVFEPGETPYDNLRFLMFMCAVIKAIDRHSDLLRMSTASVSNDFRLGGYEAPPAIISVYLGEDIEQVFRTLAEGEGAHTLSGRRIIDFGVGTLPKVYADRSDRNRTSPFAFTGNKFEFRMLGSSMSISWCNTVLNAIVAESLKEITDRLEKAEDFDREALDIVTETYRNNFRVVFSGNGYSAEWEQEAERRGLPNIRDTVDAAGALLTDKARRLFAEHRIYTGDELRARYEITLEFYAKRLLIEARTLAQMIRTEVAPAVGSYMAKLAQQADLLRDQLRRVGMAPDVQMEKLSTMAEQARALHNAQTLLEKHLEEYTGLSNDYDRAKFCRDVLLADMAGVREVSDILETQMPRSMWPFPTYNELLFSIR